MFKADHIVVSRETIGMLFVKCVALLECPPSSQILLKGSRNDREWGGTHEAPITKINTPKSSIVRRILKCPQLWRESGLKIGAIHASRKKSSMRIVRSREPSVGNYWKAINRFESEFQGFQSREESVRE